MKQAIDLFAGAGGFTEGAALAGVDVIWAANHLQIAVDTHEANHPLTHHSCQDLCQADFTTLPDFDLLLASPSCKFSTRARGSLDPAIHDADRATPWAVIACLEATEPDTFVVENVTEFRNWCSLKTGRSMFKPWMAALAALGYHVTENVLDASTFGVPQNRERLFLVGNRHRPINLVNGPTAPKPAASFMNFDSGKWSKIDKPGRAKNTLARVASGREKLGVDRFLAPYYGSGSGKTGRSLERPIGTLTTVDNWSIIDGDRMRMLTIPELLQAQGFPSDYELHVTNRNDAITMIGNSVPPPMARGVIEQVLEAS